MHPDAKVISDLRKRKLVTMQKVISFEVDKGPKFAREFVKEETDLTADMLARYSKATMDINIYGLTPFQWSMEDR